jgi:hypothetical protein
MIHFPVVFYVFAGDVLEISIPRLTNSLNAIGMIVGRKLLFPSTTTMGWPLSLELNLWKVMKCVMMRDVCVVIGTVRKEVRTEV